jgi:GNAT superfamily N-acetyltransferase
MFRKLLSLPLTDFWIVSGPHCGEAAVKLASEQWDSLQTYTSSYVLYKNNEAIASFGISTRPNAYKGPFTPWISDLVVSTPYRRQGVGTYFLETILPTLKKMYPDGLYLFTSTVDDGGFRTRFYEKLGAKIVGEFPADIFPNCVIMKFEWGGASSFAYTGG